MEQYNTASASSEQHNELSLPLLTDETSKSDVKKQEQIIVGPNAFVIGIPVGFLIVPNTATIQMSLAVLNSHFLQRDILTTAQIKQLVMHVAVSVLLVTALILLLLPENFLEEQKKKILCCGNRFLLLTGLLCGNILGLFPTLFIIMAGTDFFNFPNDFLKQLMIVTLCASSIFSIIIALSYQYVPFEDDIDYGDHTRDGELSKVITV